jgi:hypothetical protein
LYSLKVTSAVPVPSSGYISVLVGPSGVSLSNGQSTRAGSPVNITGVFATTTPSSNVSVHLNGQTFDVIAVVGSADCGADSPAYPVEYLTTSNATAGITVAEAMQAARKATVSAAMSSTSIRLRGLFCGALGEKHYYALGATRGTVAAIMQATFFGVSNVNYFAQVYLQRESGGIVSARVNVSNYDNFALAPTDSGTSELLLVIESAGSLAYTLQRLAISGCSVGDESVRVGTVGTRFTTNLCPAGDRDEVSFKITRAGVYNITLDVPTPVAIYLQPTMYEDDTRRVASVPLSCSWNTFTSTLLSQTCQISVGAGNLTFDIYGQTSQAVVDSLGVRVDFIKDCAGAQNASATFAAASTVPIVAGVRHTANFCPQGSDTHFFGIAAPRGRFSAFVLVVESVSPLPSEPLYRLDFAVLDVNQNVVTQLARQPDSSSAPTFAINLGPFAHVLRVRRLNHTSSLTPPQEYSFSYRLEACVADAHEAGHESELLPRLLALGESKEIFSICPANDIDRFRFVVESGSVYTLRVGDRVPLSEAPNTFQVRIFDARNPNFPLVVDQPMPQPATGIEYTFVTSAREVVVVVSGPVGDYDISLKPISSNQCLSKLAPEEQTTMSRPMALPYLTPWQTQSFGLSFCSARGATEQWFWQNLFFGDLQARLVANEADGNIEVAIFQGTNTTAVATMTPAQPTASIASFGTNNTAIYRVTRTAPTGAPALQQYRLLLSSYQCMPSVNSSDGAHLIESVPTSVTVAGCQNQQEDFRFDLPTASSMLRVRTVPQQQFRIVLTHVSQHAPIARNDTAGFVEVANANSGAYHASIRFSGSMTTPFTLTIEVGVARPAPAPFPSRLIGVAPTPFPVPVATPSLCGNGQPDAGEVCDGGPCCETDCRSFRPNTYQCRAATSAPCDLPEMCSGTASTCPTAETVRPATFVCRARAACIKETKCDGTGVQCPASEVDLDASCDDGSACTSGDRCQASGVCRGTFACDCNVMGVVVCDDKNECTADTCNPDGKCTNAPAAPGGFCTASALQLANAKACIDVGAAPAFKCSPDAVCTDVDSGKSCPGEPPCSGRGACCGGVCKCPAAFFGADCSQAQNDGSTPPPKEVIVSFAGAKDTAIGNGTATARVQLGDGSSLVLRTAAGSVQFGAAAVGVAGAQGNPNLLEHPEKLTLGLDGAPFVLRGLIFSEFDAARGDRAIVTLQLAGSRRRADAAPISINVSDWKAAGELPAATSFEIAPAQGGDGFGLVSVEMVAAKPSSTSSDAPNSVTSGTPTVAPAVTNDDSMFWIYVGAGIGGGVLCIIVVVVVVVCVVRRKKGGSSNDEDRKLHSVPLESMRDRPTATSSVPVGIYGTVPVQPAGTQGSEYDAVPSAASSEGYARLISDSERGSSYGQLDKTPSGSHTYAAPATGGVLQLPGAPTPTSGVLQLPSVPGGTQHYAPAPSSSHGTSFVGTYDSTAAANRAPIVSTYVGGE